MTLYRADIDGLRAVSVLLVVAFHAGIGLTGGFVGVDVFFVISGFLIARLIATDLDAGTFSLTGFWERRIRRIWPASLAVTAASLVVGWFLMLPRDLVDFAGDLIAQVTMLANVRFRTGTDYFAPASETRVLLHMWSLAVEEQFYVLFPAALAFIWRWPAWRLQVLIASVVFGIVAGQVGVVLDQSAAFFLLPFRAWELLLGVTLALVPPPREVAPLRSAVIAGCGLLLISGASLLYRASTPFPGIAAAAPCLGAALVIREGGRPGSNAVSRFLSVGPLRAVGLMSYSIYLWHWPIFAFSRYCLGLSLSGTATALALITTFALSFASWRFIERPFRRPGVLGAGLWPVATCALGASAILAGAAFLIRSGGGFPSRLDPQIVSIGSPKDVSRRWESTAGVESGRLSMPSIGADARNRQPCFLFWGDSHGMAISEVVDECAREFGVSGVAQLRAGSIPLPEVWRPGHWMGLSEADSGEIGRSTLEWIRANRPIAVVLCARWSKYLEDPEGLVARVASTSGGRMEAESAVRHGLAQVQAVCREANSELFILLEVPTQAGTPQQRAVLSRVTGAPLDPSGVSLDDHLMRKGRVNAFLHSVAAESAKFVDLADPFFDEHGISRTFRDGKSWYSDDDHINSDGAAGALKGLIHEMVGQFAPKCR